MNIGGQAVMEGVMLKSKKRTATAVRILKTDKIKVKVKKNKPIPKIFKLPFVRGIYTLIDGLVAGMASLMWSSNQNLEKEEKIKKGEMTLTLIFSLLLGVGLFLGLPFLATKYIVGKGILFSLIEGLFRVGLFIGYLAIISFSKDVQRLFQYHGAEHKVVNCYELGKKVTIRNVKKYSTQHARCGTSFIFIVLIISIIVFSFITIGWWRIAWKLVLIPVIAGVSYEILKLENRFKGRFWISFLIWPGMTLQRITTKEPDNKQIEVAMKAFEKVK
tara:strand:- start:357 stop:1178 length:822 start_codon:yes stop_codon:yes gene_type:complete